MHSQPLNLSSYLVIDDQKHDAGWANLYQRVSHYVKGKIYL